MTAYLDLDGFKARSVLRPGDVDAVETARAGFTVSRLASIQSVIDSRLRKRYAVPFGATGAPVPEIVLVWLTWIVSPEIMRARGVNPSDPQIEAIERDRALAWEQLKEAADSKEGLFDLPLSETNATSAVSAGGPLGYSETSPYAWTDIQAGRASLEDYGQRGSGDG